MKPINVMTEIKGKYQISLCRGQNCCPQLIIEGGKFIITDDFGGRVVLEKGHIEELIDEYYKLTKTPEEIHCLREGELKGLILSNVKDAIDGKGDGSIYTLEGSSNLTLGPNRKNNAI